MMKNKMDQIVSETSTDISSVKLESRLEIMIIVRKMFMEKVAPNFSLIFNNLAKITKNKNIEHSLTHNVESFKTEMIKMGYICKETIDGNKMIMENAEQRFERYLYITKIRKLREKLKKPIVYIDERVINLQFKYEKLHNIKGELPPESSVLFHAITRDGLFNELFSNQATEEQFNKWVTDMLLGLLKTPSVIVMDHSRIHGEMEATCPITMYSTKTEMWKWLNVNNIPCSPNISRPELFQLISRNKRDTKEYRIDRIIRSHGHEVLRLPNNFPGLNLTDVLWNDIVDNNYSAKIKKDSSIQILQKKIIDHILPSFSKKKWNELEKVLMMKENEIYQIDVALENMLETYVFK